MTIFISSTFSPMMLGNNVRAIVREFQLEDVVTVLDEFPEFVSAVGHESTAKIISILVDRTINFNRINVVLSDCDMVLCVIPNFRDTQSREFTKEEIVNAGFRCFIIHVCE
jgi:hypothetical protein